MKLLVINGPNINMLGIREPHIYGTQTYEDLCSLISEHAVRLGVCVECYQSNYEGDLVTKIQDAYFSHVDGIVLNPAAYTHTSVALLDALHAVNIPTVEVHISNVDAREEFRHISYVRSACIQAIWGHGFNGYLEAMDLLVNLERGCGEDTKSTECDTTTSTSIQNAASTNAQDDAKSTQTNTDKDTSCK